MTFIYLYTVMLALKGIIVNAERQITGELIYFYIIFSKYKSKPTDDSIK